MSMEMCLSRELATTVLKREMSIFLLSKEIKSAREKDVLKFILAKKIICVSIDIPSLIL